MAPTVIPVSAGHGGLWVNPSSTTRTPPAPGAWAGPVAVAPGDPDIPIQVLAAAGGEPAREHALTPLATRIAAARIAVARRYLIIGPCA